MTSLGEKLRELRGDLSLYEVEKGTGISRKELSRYEQGEYAPSPPKIEKLAELYKVSYDDLRVLYYDDFFSDPRERAIALRWAEEAKKKGLE